MKSRTSFCKLVLKDITRFAPLGIGWLVCLVYLFIRRNSFTFSTTYPVFVYGGLCALTLFGDLYNSRRCNALHAMPIRREKWFLVHTVAGLLFFLVPTALFYAGACLRITSHTSLQLVYLSCFGRATLEFICFFGIGLLCAMLTGTKIGAALIYCALCFLSPMVKFLLQLLYQPFLTSVPTEFSFLDLLSPVTRMSQLFIGYYPGFSCDPTNFSSSLIWIGSGLGYYLGCVGAGILAAVAALLLYRRRNLEKAGDFCVYPSLRYVFTTALSLIAGVLLYKLLGHDTNQFYFLFLYIPLFYIAAAMLVERKLHVFRPGHILTLCIFATVLFNSIWIVRYDFFGILDYIPKASHVRSVEVYLQDSDMVGVDNFRYDYDYFRAEGHKVVAEEDIALVTQAHEDLLYTRDNPENQGMIYLTYRLKSGRTLRRYYPLIYSKHEQAFDNLDAAVSTRASVFGDVDWEEYVGQVYRIDVSRVRGERTFCFGAAETLADAATGTVKVQGTGHMQDFLEALRVSCDDGALLQLSYDDYAVTVYSRDSWGRERQVHLILPHLSNAASPMLDMCWDAVRGDPKRTVTEDTPLVYYDITFDANGSIIRIPRTNE